jgi:NADPH:quinone reductase-like Zn-dependent oxidoreductase
LQTLGKIQPPEAQPLLQLGRPLKLTIGKPGQLDTLHFVSDLICEKPLPDDEVEVEIKANSVNRKDISIANGQFPGLQFGMDAAGVVTRVGSSCKKLQVGDRVAFVQAGSMRTVTRISADLPQKLPKDMSFEEAAAIPLVYMTAYQSLVQNAHLLNGEAVLINSAGSSLGQALISIAQVLGSEVFISIESHDQKDFMMERFGIPSDHILYSKSLSLAETIKKMTNGSGVEVVVNTSTKETLEIDLACMAPFGRLVNLEAATKTSAKPFEMRQHASNVSFSSVNIEVCFLNSE